MGTDLFQLTLSMLGLAMTGVGVLLIWVLKGMADSVKELNIKMAMICERVDSHERRINRLETT